MIPYYNPHYSLLDLVKTILCLRAENKLKPLFKEITGKKYILFTSSCRSALYLSYMAIGRKGFVHTSPLTCNVALSPIVAAGNALYFHDVNDTDWTIDCNDVSQSISNESIAIQAIHLGGFPCDMDRLRSIADAHNLVLIEDCAQSYGTQYKAMNIGRLSDIACFSLTKNLYGLGGGILATDNEDIFTTAQRIQNSFPKANLLKILYRLFIALLSNYRNIPIFNYVFIKTKLVAKEKKSKSKVDNSLIKELVRPSSIYMKSVACRIDKIHRIIDSDIKTAHKIQKLFDGLGVAYQKNQYATSSYSKLYMRINSKSSENAIRLLNKIGIEAMHLEQKLFTYYQPPFSEDIWNTSTTSVCNSVYNSIIALPIAKEIIYKWNEIKEIIMEESH